MKLNKLMVLLMAGLLTLGAAACGNGNDSSGDSDTAETAAEADSENAADAAAEDDGQGSVSFENLTVDTENKEITFQAIVNGTYFTEPSRHAIVWEDGGNADKSMFRTSAYNVDFYDALEALGLSGDSNVSMDDMSASVEDNVINTGDAIEYFIKWEGQDEIPLMDVIKASADYEWNTVFAGNREVAVETQAGCLLCIDSCAAGISVNALPVGTTGDGGIQFTLDEEKMPEDGSTVEIIVRPAE